MKVKVNDLRQQSMEELQQLLKETEMSLFKTKFQHTSTPVANPMVIREQRRTIARLKTLLHEKK